MLRHKSVVLSWLHGAPRDGWIARLQCHRKFRSYYKFSFSFLVRYPSWMSLETAKIFMMVTSIWYPSISQSSILSLLSTSCLFYSLSRYPSASSFRENLSRVDIISETTPNQLEITFLVSGLGNQLFVAMRNICKVQQRLSNIQWTNICPHLMQLF